MPHVTNSNGSTPSSYSKTNYFNLFVGGACMGLGGIGCVLTSPLLLLGGGIGYLTGLFSNKNEYEMGLKGAAIGSFGTLLLAQFGFHLFNADEGAEVAGLLGHKPESSKQESTNEFTNPLAKLNPEIIIREQASPTLPVLVEAQIETKTVTSHVVEPMSTHVLQRTVSKSPYKSTDPVNFNNPDEVNQFTAHLNKIAGEQEARDRLSRDNTKVFKVKEAYIKTLIEVTKNSFSTDHDFWGRLEQMSEHDIDLFVKQLNSNKENGKYRLSELEYVWRRFTHIEFEPSVLEKRKQSFSSIIKALTDKQLKDCLTSAEFLNVLKQDAFIEVAANTFNSHQIAIFASFSEHLNIMVPIIKKFKPDLNLLGKLLAILPIANWGMKEDLMIQVSHLPYHASFNVELSKLLDYHVRCNTEAAQITQDIEEESPLIEPGV